MKPINVALFAALGMMLTSISVYSLTPPGGSQTQLASADPTVITEQIAGNVLAQTELARFTSGSTLMIDGRLGHARLNPSSPETFVMLEVRGENPNKAKTRAPANLSLVIDRSGSMKGSRLPNAIQAATTAIEQLNDGDMVSVISFDTRTTLVVPPTTLSSANRSRILADLRTITLGGDTCISCGIEEGLVQLEQTADRVNRMIVLSDGDATSGVRDIPGFRSIAERARDRGVSITTIGVDVDYNEKILSAIAQESNGRHYFVENDASLARIFETEAENLTSTIASGAEVAIELAPGVELDRVFDRSFRRSGNRILVPLGAFSQGDVKTVLLKVRLNNQNLGAHPVADIDMTYRDLVAGNDSHCTGKLSTELVDQGTPASELDGVVAGRVQRSETAAALKQANFLFQQGRLEDARKKLQTQQKNLEAEATKAKRFAPASRAKDVEFDFEQQIAALSTANSNFATPPPAATATSPFATPPGAQVAAQPAPVTPPQQSRQGKGGVRLNEENATNFGF